MNDRKGDKRMKDKSTPDDGKAMPKEMVDAKLWPISGATNGNKRPAIARAHVARFAFFVPTIIALLLLLVPKANSLQMLAKIEETSP